MATTALTVITPLGPYPGTVAADALDVTFQAADAANGNHFRITGKELMIIRNSHGANAITFTLASSNDQYGRLGNITTYSLPAGEFAAFNFSNTHGWADASGNVSITWAGTGTPEIRIFKYA